MIKLLWIGVLAITTPAYANNAKSCATIFDSLSITSTIHNELKTAYDKTFERMFLMNSQISAEEFRGSDNYRIVDTSATKRQGGLAILEKRDKDDPKFHDLLIHLGFQNVTRIIGKNEVTQLMPPKNILELSAKAVEFIDSAIASGKISKEHAVWPVLIFQPRELTFPANEDYVFVVPGKDPWPNDNYQLVEEVPQFKHHFFETLVARGKFPIGLGFMFAHDFFGHILHFLSDLDVMRETRVAYKKAAARSPNFRSVVENDREFTTYKFQKSKDPKLAYYFRVYFWAEFFSLPDTKKSSQVLELVGPLQNEPLDRALNFEITRLQKSENLIEETTKFLDRASDVITPIGGGANDIFSPISFFDDNRIGGYLWSKMTYGPDHYLASANLLAVASETLASQTWLLKLACKLYTDGHGGIFNHPELQLTEKQLQNLKALVVDTAARLKVALYAGAKLKMTPADLIRDSSETFVSLDSKTYQYLKSFVHPDSWTAKSFFNVPETFSSP